MAERILKAMADGAQISVLRYNSAASSKGLIVLLHEIFGVTFDMERLALAYANAGYDVVIPSLFDREAPDFVGRYSPEDTSRGLALIRQEHPFALSVSDALTCAALANPESPVFMVGYCYGGSVAWACAAESRNLTAISSFYGAQIIGPLSDLEPCCPTLLHFGSEDDSISLKSVRKWATNAPPNVVLQVYKAGHGFCSAGRSSYNSLAVEASFEATILHFEMALAQKRRNVSQGA